MTNGGTIVSRHTESDSVGAWDGEIRQHNLRDYGNPK